MTRHCRNDLTNEMKKIFVKNRVRYTQALCYKLCEQRFIEQHCQCIEPTVAVFYQFFNNDNIPYFQKPKNLSLCSIDDKCLILRTNFSKLNS